MDRRTLYLEFQKQFPIEKLQEMTLEEYTNLDRDNSFCYWLESKTYELGSIWGGSSYKFGIYRYDKKPDNPSVVISDEEYAWYKKYNASNRIEAFEVVQNAVIKIAYAALKGDYKIIEEDNTFGDVQMAQFSDEHMNLLFQRFVMEYYRQHHPEYKVSAKQIKWNLDESNTSSSSILPIMQSDITLQIDERTLIIDTKYYSKNMQKHFGKFTIHSPNFYQIHTYVMNEDKGHKGNVDGMLLYAQTDANIQPEGTYPTNDGNILMVRTLDLSNDFNHIKQSLEHLIQYRYES